jgi:hypothetical protein
MIPLYKTTRLEYVSHACTQEKYSKKICITSNSFGCSLHGQNMFVMLPPLPSSKKETRKNMFGIPRP